MTVSLVDHVTAEYQRYQSLAEAAFAQLEPEQLHDRSAGPNAVVILVWHVSGNLEARFTDFLETDGEKPWRDRDSEFDDRIVTPEQLREKWERGWSTLFATLSSLTDADLRRSITIRGVALHVDEALLRSLAHVAYHVGQIVQTCRTLRGDSWRTLSVPRGGSAEYTSRADRETAADHARWLRRRLEEDDASGSRPDRG